MEGKRVSFCACNNGFEDVKDTVTNEFPQHTTTLNKCIGACDKCGWDFIARIDGELVVGESKEELYKKIKDKLKK